MTEQKETQCGFTWPYNKIYTWQIKVGGTVIQFLDPAPNRVQKWLMEKCFNIKVIVYDR